jgi:hypothetical protein
MIFAEKSCLVLLLGLIWAIGACATARPDAHAGGGAQATNTSHGDTRALAPHATFSDLVASMQELDGLRRRKKGCLLSQRPDGFHFQAAVLSMVDPIPAAPKELDRHLQKAERVRVITEDGSLGPPTSLAFATLTSTEVVASYAVIVALTDQGLYVRSSDFDLEPGTPLTPAKDEDLERLLSTAPGLSTLYLSAEADVPLQRIYKVLSVLGTYGPVVFALAVRSTPQDMASPTDPACPTVARSGERQRSTARVQQRANDIQADLALCMYKMQRARLNGRVLVAVEFRPDGSIQSSCVKEDQTGSETLRSCLRDVLRAEAGSVLPAGDTRTLLTAMTISRPRTSWSFAGDAVCR